MFSQKVVERYERWTFVILSVQFNKLLYIKSLGNQVLRTTSRYMNVRTVKLLYARVYKLGALLFTECSYIIKRMLKDKSSKIYCNFFRLFSVFSALMVRDYLPKIKKDVAKYLCFWACARAHPLHSYFLLRSLIFPGKIKIDNFNHN